MVVVRDAAVPHVEFQERRELRAATIDAHHASRMPAHDPRALRHALRPREANVRAGRQ